MLTYKLYYNIAPTYLYELISKQESHLNTRLGTDHHQLIIPPISKDDLTFFTNYTSGHVEAASGSDTEIQFFGH